MLKSQAAVGQQRSTASLIGCPPWSEAWLITTVVALMVAAWLMSLNGLSLSWDALNHHFYLGWMAVEGDRLETDVFAAGSMSCQYPYAYAPLYLLLRAGASGVHAALALALPAVVSIPAIWLMAWTFWPRSGWHARAARSAFTGIALLSPLWWSLLDSTSNDILSTLPMVWAIAIVVWQAGIDLERGNGRIGGARVIWWVLAGVFSALALMLKISHVFAALGVVVIVVTASVGFVASLQRLGLMLLGATLVGMLLWWPWARHVWAECGSPIYPMLVEALRPFGSKLP